MHEPLREEPLEQSLYYRMLQMQLRHFIRRLIGVVTDNRAHGRLAPPVENVLILPAFCAQGIGRLDPAGAGLPGRAPESHTGGSSDGPGIRRSPSQPARAGLRRTVSHGDSALRDTPLLYGIGGDMFH